MGQVAHEPLICPTAQAQKRSCQIHLLGRTWPLVRHALPDGAGGLGLQAPRARLPRRPVRSLGQGQEPETSSLQPGPGSVLAQRVALATDARVRTGHPPLCLSMTGRATDQLLVCGVKSAGEFKRRQRFTGQLCWVAPGITASSNAGSLPAWREYWGSETFAAEFKPPGTSRGAEGYL